MTTVTFDDIMAIVAEPVEPSYENGKLVSYEQLIEFCEPDMFADCDHVTDGVMVPWFKDHKPYPAQTQTAPHKVERPSGVVRNVSYRWSKSLLNYTLS